MPVHLGKMKKIQCYSLPVFTLQNLQSLLKIMDYPLMLFNSMSDSVSGLQLAKIGKYILSEDRVFNSSMHAWVRASVRGLFSSLPVFLKDVPARTQWLPWERRDDSSAPNVPLVLPASMCVPKETEQFSFSCLLGSPLLLDLFHFSWQHI